jgi:tRNA A-37 threonylcarbamoyl transferase component Bud32
MPLKTEGKIYKTFFGEIMLYPISMLSKKLAEVGIKRDTQTLRKWEAKGIIPPTIWRIGYKRLFTMEQIEAIVRVAQECSIRQGEDLRENNFVQRIGDELIELNKKYLKK